MTPEFDGSSTPTDGRRWDLWFRLILVQSFLLHALTAILRVAISYRTLEIGLDAWWVGIIGGAFGALPAIFGIHLGVIIDRIGEGRPLLMGATIVLIGASGIWIYGDNLPVLVACSLALGLGQFTCIATQHAVVARCIDPKKRDSAFGIFTVVISLAQALSPGLLALFDRDSALPDTQGIFLLGLGTAALLVLATSLTKLPEHLPVAERKGLLRAMQTLVRVKGFSLSLLAALVVVAGIDLLVIYLPLYGAENGISAAVIGYLLAVRATASIASRLMFSWLIRLLGRGGLLALSMLLAGFGIALLPFTTDISLLTLELIATGLGLGIGSPLTLAWIAETSPVGMRGMALSFRLAANRVGQAALPIAASALVVGVGASGVFWAMAGILSVSALLCYRHFALERGPQ
jgi:MFS family permease